MFKKNKIIIILIIIGVVYILGWWIFFAKGSEKVVVKDERGYIEKIEEKANVHGNDVSSKNEEKDNDKKDDKKEFKNFGNFWVEIHKDGLDIKAPVENGTQPVDLEKGIGHHPTTSYPSEEGGNVVLSGHRWKFGNNPAYKVFEDLNELEIGDKVSLFYLGREYIYKIREQKVVKDSDVSILKNTKKSQLTMYTCTPKYTSFKRLVYIADLVEVL